MSFNTRMRFSQCVCCAVVLLAMTACQQQTTGPQRMAVSGTVTIGGIPLAAGMISMVPQADGPAAGGEIADGKFAISERRGPAAGVYDVRVTVAAQKSMSDNPQPGGPRVFRKEVTVSEETPSLSLEFQATE